MPTRAEFDEAAFRERTRNAYSSRLKLWRMKGWDEVELRSTFTQRDLAMLSEDSPERIEADRRIIERYERAQGTSSDEEVSGHAARARQKLRSMTRILNR